MNMNKLIFSSIFLLFSYLQFNDGVDAYLWAFIYFMAASITFFDSYITKYKVYFLLSIITFYECTITDSVCTIFLNT